MAQLDRSFAMKAFLTGAVVALGLLPRIALAKRYFPVLPANRSRCEVRLHDDGGMRAGARKQLSLSMHHASRCEGSNRPRRAPWRASRHTCQAVTSNSIQPISFRPRRFKNLSLGLISIYGAGPAGCLPHRTSTIKGDTLDAVRGG